MSTVETARSISRTAVARLSEAYRLRGPLSENPRASILNGMAVGVLAWLLFHLLIILPFFATRKAANLAIVLSVGAVAVITRHLLRRGSLQTAAAVYISSLWVVFSIVVLLNGGIRSPCLAFYVTLPIAAASVMGYAGAIRFTLVCLGSAVLFAVLETLGLGPYWYFRGVPFGLLTAIILAILIAAVPAVKVMRLLEGELARSILARDARTEELRKLMEVAPVALLVSRDVGGREIIGNRMANAMFEVEEGTNLSGDSGGDKPARWQFVREQVAILPEEQPVRISASRGIDVRDWEAELITPGGARRFISGNATPLRDADGSVRGAVAAFVDITQTKRRSDAVLHESEERFERMANAAPVLIWAAGVDKLCTFFNQGWLDFTGRTLEQELGNGWAQGVHPEDLERCVSNYSSSFDARSAFQMEYRLRRADGEFRWVLDSGVPRSTPDGVFAGYIGSCVDITELKHKQERDLLTQKLETIGGLARGLAHDFNNLLATVLAESELALLELAEDGSPKEELTHIRTAAIHGAGIVRQLMIYSGQETEVIEDVNVSAIARDMLELLKVRVSTHGVIESDLADALPAVRANPSQLRQVVMNLIINACDALGERGGVIRVITRRLKPDSDPAALPTDGAVGESVQLEVRDTGIGMSPEVQARIFEPGFTTRGSGNHGHGLAVVKRIVERLHGSIRVLSAPGAGATFQITLPGYEASLASPVTTKRTTTEETRPVRSATILIVEDEDSLRRALAKTLQRNGMLILEAADGTSALEMIREHCARIDILLLDSTLPGTAARKLYDELKLLRPGMPVVFMSAMPEASAAESFGVNIKGKFIRKPFKLAELVEKIGKALAPRTKTAAD